MKSREAPQPLGADWRTKKNAAQFDWGALIAFIAATVSQSPPFNKVSVGGLPMTCQRKPGHFGASLLFMTGKIKNGWFFNKRSNVGGAKL